MNTYNRYNSVLTVIANNIKEKRKFYAVGEPAPERVFFQRDKIYSLTIY